MRLSKLVREHLDGVLEGRADGADTVFVENALSYIETETYNAEVPPLEGRTYVPFDSAPEGANDITYRQYTRTGMARLISARGEDVPEVGLYVREYSKKFYRLGASYSYTLDELLNAKFSTSKGVPINLDAEKGISAREAIEKAIDGVCAIGSTTSTAIPGLSQGIGADVGLIGLLNIPNATVYTVQAGISASTLWANKTPDEKLADLAGIVAAQISGTFKVHKPTRILLPVNQHQNASMTRMGDGSDADLFTVFKKMAPFITVDSWQYCQGAGTAGTDRMVAFEANKRRVRMVMSEEFRQLPPEVRRLVFSTLCTARTAGVLCQYPLSVSYGDGI